MGANNGKQYGSDGESAVPEGGLRHVLGVTEGAWEEQESAASPPKVLGDDLPLPVVQQHVAVLFPGKIWKSV